MTTGGEPIPGLLDPAVAVDPHALYRRLRAEHPCHWDASIGSWLVTRHADVGAGYRDPAFTTKNYEWQLEPVFGRGLLQMDGREHARKRALVNPHFRGKGAQRWDGVIARNAQALIERIARPVGPVEFCHQYAHQLPIAVIAEVLGLPESDQPQFFAWYTAMIAFLSNLAKDPTVAAAGVRAKAEFDAYITPFISKRRAEPGDDLISAMCTSLVDGESLDDTEVRAHVTQLLVAGAETTDRTLGNMIALLLMHREQFEAVRADRDLVPAAIAETLRHSPPSQMNARVLDRDVEIAGVPVPAGATVTLVIASANRDERRFTEPDRFDIHRCDLSPERAFAATGEHFAFGSGRHFCLGAMLAKAELEYSANALLDRFPTMRLADDFTPAFAGLKMRAVPALQLVL